jgi:uncharacterized membrane protein
MATMPDYELLLHLYEAQLKQLEYRRARENEIFNWSSAILVGFIGAALLLTSDKRGLLLQTWFGAGLAAGAMLIVTTFSVMWQLKQRYFLAETQKVIVSLEQSLGLFDAPYALPAHWKEWGEKNVTFRDRVRKPSKIAATVLLGVLAVAAAILAVLVS